MWLGMVMCCLLVSVAACAGANPVPSVSRSTVSVDGWVGATPAEPVPGTIQLSEGERLVQLLGWTALPRESGDGRVASCALYGLRVRPDGLEEGRASAPCPGSDSPRTLVTAIRFARADAERTTRLHAALRDASPRIRRSSGAVSVWLETDRRVIRGHVPEPRWPAPYAEATPLAHDRAPADLAEVWEAVMYPARYASR